MKRLAGLSALALIISSTSGCGWLWGEDGYFRDRGNDYLEARETAPMQVPAGLNAKRLDPLLPIPGAVSSARPASDVEFEVPRPPALSAAAAEASDFSLQKSGSARWIVAQRPPAEVWPVARQFFEENGFSIAEEQPQTGEFSTAWQSLDNVSATLARSACRTGMREVRPFSITAMSPVRAKLCRAGSVADAMASTSEAPSVMAGADAPARRLE